jgi:transposase
MESTNKMVTLANGKQVHWDEFSNWSSKKQNNSMNPPAKGVRMSLEKCADISKRQRDFYSNGDHRPRRTGKANKSSKSVITPNGKFESINAVARHYAVSRDDVCKWIKKVKPTEFYFSTPYEKSAQISMSRQAVMTPEGRFPTMSGAAIHFGVDYQTIKAWINGTGRYAGKFHFCESDTSDIKCKNTKRVMTPVGPFESIRAASNILGIAEGKISRWAKRKKDGVYYFI